MTGRKKDVALAVITQKYRTTTDFGNWQGSHKCDRDQGLDAATVRSRQVQGLDTTFEIHSRLGRFFKDPPTGFSLYPLKPLPTLLGWSQGIVLALQIFLRDSCRPLLFSNNVLLLLNATSS
jgi:hypothetical protein